MTVQTIPTSWIEDLNRPPTRNIGAELIKVYNAYRKTCAVCQTPGNTCLNCQKLQEALK